jgi:ABC-type glycerol-3-phosphate transport system substrate-binding protein
MMDKEVAVDDLGERSQDALPAAPEPEAKGHSRRDFLKRAAGVAVGLPLAGALAGNAAAVPRISTTSRAKPFDGITLQFAKAPFGNDEKDFMGKLIKPWEDKTGAKVVITTVPWQTEGATYATNYAGPNPFDVSYQTSTDLTGLGTKGVLEPLNTSKWLDNPNYASTKAKFIPNALAKSMYKGKLYGLPCIIGGTVIYYNKDLLGKANIANIPRTEPELMAAAVKISKLGGGVWGHNVPLSNKDFAWYFTYSGLHNHGTDIISADQSKVTFNNSKAAAALQFYVDMVTNKAQPPVGQYDRDAALALFQAGRPLRLPVFRSAKLPFKFDFINPVGVGSKRTIFSTTGHWVMASKGKNKDAAWDFVKFLSSPAFAGPFGQHYGWAPVRSDVNTAKDPATGKSDPQVVRVNSYVLKGWDGLPTGPKMAQLTDVYGQAIEAAATGSKSVKAALAKAQADGTAILKS